MLTLDEAFTLVKKRLGTPLYIFVENGILRALKEEEYSAQEYMEVPVTHADTVMGTLKRTGLRGSNSRYHGFGYFDEIHELLPAAAPLCFDPQPIFAQEKNPVTIRIFPEEPDFVFVLGDSNHWMKQIPIQHGVASTLIISEKHHGAFCGRQGITASIDEYGHIFATRRVALNIESFRALLDWRKPVDVTPINMFLMDSGGEQLLTLGGVIEFALSDTIGTLSLCPEDSEQPVVLQEATFPDIPFEAKFDVSLWWKMSPERACFKDRTVITQNDAFTGVLAYRR
jgi:hypothetical protein